MLYPLRGRPPLLLALPPSPSDAAALACLCRASRAAARGSKWADAVRVSPVSGRVREPASGHFDVEVAPGASLQAAVDRCRPGGAILLRPGMHHVGFVSIAREVHVFGRGEATLQVPRSGRALACTAAAATLDGLSVRGPPEAPPIPAGTCVAAVIIAAGAARLQDCDMRTSVTAVGVISGADPVLFNCR